MSNVRLSDGTVTLLLPHPNYHFGTTAEATEAYAAAISQSLASPPREEEKMEEQKGKSGDSGGHTRRGKTRIPTLDGWHARFNLERHGLRVSESTSTGS